MKALFLRHGRKLNRLYLPVVLPVREGVDKLWLRQASTSIHEETTLATVLVISFLPCTPAHRELLVHHALDANLPEVRDALLLLLLKLQLMLALEFSGATVTRDCSLTSTHELGSQLCNF